MSLCFVRPRDMFQTIFDNLKPGGWIESQDYLMKSIPANDSLTERVAQSAAVEAQRLLIDVIATIPGYNREIFSPDMWKAELINIGFVDVQEKIVLFPASAWHTGDAKQHHIGLVARKMLMDAMDTGLVKVFALAGWSEERIAALVRRTIQDHDDPTYQTYAAM